MLKKITIYCEDNFMYGDIKMFPRIHISANLLATKPQHTLAAKTATSPKGWECEGVMSSLDTRGLLFFIKNISFSEVIHPGLVINLPSNWTIYLFIYLSWGGKFNKNNARPVHYFCCTLQWKHITKAVNVFHPKCRIENLLFIHMHPCTTNTHRKRPTDL